jgi:DNA repair protein RadA/Sms
VAFTAPPETQSELLLEQVARNNDSAYVTTVRDEATVADRLPGTTVGGATAEDLLSDPESYLEVPASGCLIVDAVTRLERHSDTYRDFLEVASRRAREVDGVVFLHAHEVAVDPPERWHTLAKADMTWRLSLKVNPLAVETRLAVTKNRRGAALSEPLKLRFTDHLSIDSSRDI